MIGVVYPKDNWILQKIGKTILEVDGVTYGRQNITYWINWVYWEHNKLVKSKIDGVWFTHFDSDKRMHILNKADFIVCQSSHGRKELLEQGVIEDKIKSFPYMGVSTAVKKKIIIGTSGRDYNTGRKNRAERDRLKKDLDSSVFEFIHKDTTDDDYWKTIDYFLQTSTAEGGAMDVLNAIYARIPVVSRDIGHIYDFKTSNDFIYNSYEDILSYFKDIEGRIKQKDNHSVNFTWDNFKKWHLVLFNELSAGGG